MIFYLDSSAWVKRHFREPGTEWIARFWNARPQVACATLGLIEVLATLSRRTPQSQSGSIAAAMALAKADFAGMVEVPLIGPVLEIAQHLAAVRKLRGADCVHLGSAMYLRDQLREPLAMVSCDRELVDAAVAEGLLACDPTTDALPV